MHNKIPIYSTVRLRPVFVLDCGSLSNKKSDVSTSAPSSTPAPAPASSLDPEPEPDPKDDAQSGEQGPQSRQTHTLAECWVLLANGHLMLASAARMMTLTH